MKTGTINEEPLWGDGMTSSQVVLHRRALLATGLAALAAPLTGCSTTPAEKGEARERRSFIESAMHDLQEEARKQSEAQQGRGAAPALSLSTLVPFGDWDYYYIKGGSIIWRPNPGQSFQLVEVPEGFVTDLTSIPRIFWQVARPEGRYAYAAVVHDYLYWTQSRTRAEADQILRYAMEDSKVGAAERWAIYQAVDKLGQSAWDRNIKLRSGGERRMLAKFPSDLSASWEDWKKLPGNLRQ